MLCHKLKYAHYTAKHFEIKSELSAYDLVVSWARHTGFKIYK